jgi:hypothetical protein
VAIGVRGIVGNLLHMGCFCLRGWTSDVKDERRDVEKSNRAGTLDWLWRRGSKAAASGGMTSRLARVAKLDTSRQMPSAWTCTIGNLFPTIRQCPNRRLTCFVAPCRLAHNRACNRHSHACFVLPCHVHAIAHSKVCTCCQRVHLRWCSCCDNVEVLRTRLQEQVPHSSSDQIPLMACSHCLVSFISSLRKHWESRSAGHAA